MRHIVLLRCEEGYLTEETFRELAGAYRAAVGAIDGIEGLEMHRNCYERESNMDFMASFTVKDPATLTRFIKSPLHRAIAEKNDPHVISRATFDYSD